MGADKEDGVTAILPAPVLDLIMKLEAAAAEKAYTAYCGAVGGVAFNGDPLPSWATVVADEKKQKVVEAWRITANAMVAFTLRKFLISADTALVAAVDKTCTACEPASSGETTTPAPAAVPVDSDK